MAFLKVQLNAKKLSPKGYPKEIKNIGDHIRKRRLDLNLTVEKAAQQMQTAHCNIHNWEQHRRRPHISSMPKIIEFLGYVPWKISCNTLGQRIATYRRLFGLTQRQFASKIGTDRWAVDSWENDCYKPEKEQLEKLTEFLADID